MFEKSVYLKRRAELLARLKGQSGIAVFIGNVEAPAQYRDNCYKWRQNSTWLYYFGIDEPRFAATVDLAQVYPKPPKPTAKPEAEKVASTDDGVKEEKGVAGSVWLDALAAVLKRVPVMNAVMQPVDYRLMPVENNRIEGANPEKVFFYVAPDDSMRGFRIHRDDVVFVVPAQSPIDGAVMLVEYGVHRGIRKIKRIDDTKVLLQAYDHEYDAETWNLNEVTFIGRCTRVEATL